jgi:hypothetical protein
MSRGQLGGRKLALAGTMIGSASLVIQGYVLIKLGDWQLRQIEQRSIAGISQFMQAAQDQDPFAARRHLSNSLSAQLTDEQITQFGEAVTRRYGRLNGFRVTHRDVRGGLGSSEIEVAGFFAFAGAQMPGSARFLTGPAGIDLAPSLFIDRLLVTDADHGDMSLPPSNPDKSADEGKPGSDNSQEHAGDRTMPPTKE